MTYIRARALVFLLVVQVAFVALFGYDDVIWVIPLGALGVYDLHHVSVLFWYGFVGTVSVLAFVLLSISIVPCIKLFNHWSNLPLERSSWCQLRTIS